MSNRMPATSISTMEEIAATGLDLAFTVRGYQSQIANPDARRPTAWLAWQRRRRDPNPRVAASISLPAWPLGGAVSGRGQASVPHGRAVDLEECRALELRRKPCGAATVQSAAL